MLSKVGFEILHFEYFSIVVLTLIRLWAIMDSWLSTATLRRKLIAARWVMTTTGKKLNECGHELNTDVELVAGDVNGTNFKRYLNLKLLFAWSLSHIGVVRHEEQTQ